MTLTVVALVVLVGIGYAVWALSGSHDSSSPGSSRVALPSDRPSATASHRPTKHTTPTLHVMSAYYLGPGPRGPVLHATTSYRPPSGAMSLVLSMLEEQPDQPQYHTFWQPGWLAGVRHADGLISVDVSQAPAGLPRTMDVRTAAASVQQVVYTLQSVTHSHDPVRFTRHGKPAATVLGVPVATPVQARPPALVVSRMNVLEPSIDEEHQGHGPYTVSGTASTAQGRVTVRIEQHGVVLETRTVHTRGSGDPNRLYPWHVVIGLRGFKAGTYQVIASGADPSDPSLTVTDQQPLVQD